jgi:hypothetical protein
VEARGGDEGTAITILAERTRALYGAVLNLVETVEEVEHTYNDTAADRDED